MFQIKYSLVFSTSFNEISCKIRNYIYITGQIIAGSRQSAAIIISPLNRLALVKCNTKYLLYIVSVII